jgi:hypothetical protein
VERKLAEWQRMFSGFSASYDEQIRALQDRLAALEAKGG